MKQKLAAGHLMALFVATVWGTAFIAVKVLLAEFHPIEVMLFRFAIAWAALFLFSPKPLRSTMGSVFRQPVFLSSDLPETIRELQKLELPVYAALLEPGARTVQELPRAGGFGVIVGNEGNGVSKEAAADGGVYIPMAPAIESLNAAAAATIIMWEMSGRDRK